MLFNSYTFIFAFLPLTLALYYLLRSVDLDRQSIVLLVLASLVYYGWWDPKYLLLIAFLIVFNYFLAHGLLATRNTKPIWAKALLIGGLAVNLGFLCYYKYANFLVDNANWLWGSHLNLAAVVLPIGISFFTFQKIAFLVDVHQGKVRQINFVDFLLFVTFFPQLIAGPIVHHSEVMPQFHRARAFSLNQFALGLTFFAIGLCKKMVLADTAAQFATPQFQAAAGGMHLDFLAAWSAALAYSAQLYFDFSAYSDMAIGLGQLFGIDLPLNFNSPYKAHNIIDFWRRWHMTLSRFLRDYLYIPLGGNRKGPKRRYVNLFLTMVLGGMWHGAGWTFIVWGALHGMYLGINHAWNALKSALNLGALGPPRLSAFGARLLTFASVVVGWVFFRADDVGTALSILKGMAGGNGFALPASLYSPAVAVPASQAPVDSGFAFAVAVAFLLLAMTAPNSQELLGYSGCRTPSSYAAAGNRPPTWQPSLRWALYAGALLAVSLTMFSHVSEFIYFQF